MKGCESSYSITIAARNVMTQWGLGGTGRRGANDNRSHSSGSRQVGKARHPQCIGNPLCKAPESRQRHPSSTSEP